MIIRSLSGEKTWCRKGEVEPRVTPHQILSLREHQVKSYEKLTKPWGFAGFQQTK